MIALLCAVALLPHDEPKVTLRLPATALGAIAKQVSEATSVAIIVDQKFAEMPLIVSVKDVPLNEFLGKVAQSMDLDVRPYASGFRLMRTAEHLARMEDADRQEYYKRWAYSIARTRKELEKTPWTTKVAEKLVTEEKKRVKELQKKIRAAGASGGNDPSIWKEMANRKAGVEELKPSARLAFRLIQAIGPKELARLPLDRPIVFSRFPNSMQTPMPPQLEQFVAQYVRESAQNPVVERETEGDGNEEGMMHTTLEKIAGPIGKVLLRIPSARSPTASIQIYSKDGKQSDQGSFGMLSYIPSVSEELGPRPKPEGKKPETMQPFRLTPLSRELVRFLGEAMNHETNRSMQADEEESEIPFPRTSDALREALLSPETRDPLSYEISECLLEYATQKQVNLIVRPQENSYWLGQIEEGNIDKEGRADMNSVLPFLLQQGESEVDPPGWVVRGIDEPLYQESGFISRRALGPFVRSVAKNGLNFDAEVNFATSLSPDVGEGMMIDLPVFTMLQEDGIDAWLFHGARLALSRFIGSLSATQRQTASRGGLVAAGLSRDQLASLHALLFSEDFFLMGRMQGMQDMDPTGDELTTSFMFEDATEAFPDGVPPETMLTIKTTREETYESSDGDRSSAKELAIASLVARKFPKVEGAQDIIDSLPTKVRPLTIVTHNVRLKVLKTNLGQEYQYTHPRGSKALISVDSSTIRADLAPWIKRFESLTFEQLELAFYGSEEP